jgi:hypothetical protein
VLPKLSSSFPATQQPACADCCCQALLALSAGSVDRLSRPAACAVLCEGNRCLPQRLRWLVRLVNF